MRADPSLSMVDSLISALQNCRHKKSVHQATQLHAILCQHHLELHPVLGNFLIPVLVECGDFLAARHVFDRLVHPNEHSWTSLISGYTDRGEPQHALHLYRMMVEEGCVQPSKYTYVALFSACSRLEDAAMSQEIHTETTKRGVEKELYIGSSLVDTYSKCGLLQEARLVFDRLAVKDAVSWNTLITGYTENGLGEEVLNSFNQMQLEGACADTVTFVCSLKACGIIGDIKTGQKLHSETAKRGLENNIYIGSTLVGMYAKHGFLFESQQVFDSLPARNEVSWATLIAGYMRHGFNEEAEKSYQQMELDCVTADAITFACRLKACGISGQLETGHIINSEIIKRGLERELYVGSTLVDMYIKCGSLEEATIVFDQLPSRSAVSWNALIAGYAEHTLDKKVQNSLSKMQVEGLSPDPVTYICSLKACSGTKVLETGWQLHLELTKRGLEREVYVGNALVDMYIKCKSFDQAQNVFDGLLDPDGIAWNALIAGYVEHGLNKEALNCLHEMDLRGVAMDVATFVCSLKACGSIGALDTGQEIHAEVIKKGLEVEFNIGSTLVDMYNNCSSLAEAYQVFGALAVLDAVSWNALIGAYAEHDLGEQALDCYRQMQTEGFSANATTLVFCLKACGTTGALALGQEIHDEIRKSGLDTNVYLSSMLVDMYGKCGSLAEGQEVFDKLLVRDIVSWTAMINAYGENHQPKMALQCFQQMLEQRVRPDAVTFTCLLAACSHASLILEGQECFKLMIKQFAVEPTLDHYACMVDLFARSGRINEAETFFAAMQCPPSNIILMDLLSACKIYGKVELGQNYFQQLRKVDQRDAAPYLVMADLYTSNARWSDANEVEEMRILAGAKKKPGRALVEVSDKLYGFVVGTDKSNDLFDSLELLSVDMKNKGYIPNLVLVSEYISNEKETGVTS